MNAITDTTTRAARLFDLASVRFPDTPPLRCAYDLIAEARAILEAERDAADAAVERMHDVLDAWPSDDSDERGDLCRKLGDTIDRAKHLNTDARALAGLERELEGML